MFDGKAFGDEMTAIVKGYVDRATEPLLKRIETLEQRPVPERGEKGDHGPVGADGRSVSGAEIRDGVLVLRLTDGAELEAGNVVGADGRDGADAEPPAPEAIAVVFRPMAEEIVSEAVAAGIAKLPPPEKGEKGDQGEPGANGADGRGIADLLVDRDGNLIAAFDDGRMKNVGPAQGRDGKDGRDAFELDDYDEWFEDNGRTLVRRYVRGEDFKEFRHQTALPIDRGVFKAGESYAIGDAVSWGGSLWIAQRETDAKPDGPDSGWRLAVKKGRDGKDAK